MRHARGLHPRCTMAALIDLLITKPQKGPWPHKKQTHTDVRGHPCTHAHTQQETVRVLQAEALMQGTGSEEHPKLPNMACVACTYKCGQLLIKAGNKGVKAREGHHSP